MPDNTLYLYTSLTAGSSHIVTATARLETILKANKLPFQAIDIATDDTARKLWGRRSRGRKLPGLVKSGMIVGDLEEIEEWNEYGELRMQVNNVQALDSFPDPTTTTTTTSAAETPTAEGSAGGTQSTTQPAAAPKQSTIKIQSPPSKQETKDSSVSLAMRQASEEAASKAKENKANAGSKPAAAATSAPASGAGPAEKEEESEKEKPESESGTATTTAAPTTTAADKKGDDDSVRRKSIIGEIAGEVRRPKLVPEDAAVSSANLHADNPAALREHHRTSIVSATSKEERDQVAQDLRKSISGGNDEMLESLRTGHGHSSSSGKGKMDGDGQEVRTIETIPQDPFEDE